MPKLVDHQKRRAEIMVHARDLTTERGVDGLRLRDLAQRCGFAHGALRHYFVDKEALVHALAVDATLQIKNYLYAQGYARARGLEALSTLYGSVVDTDPELRSSRRVLSGMSDYVAASPRVRELVRQQVTMLRTHTLKHLEEARADGTLGGARSVEATTSMLMHLASGYSATLWMDPADMFADYAGEVLASVLRSA